MPTLGREVWVISIPKNLRASVYARRVDLNVCSTDLHSAL